MASYVISRSYPECDESISEPLSPADSSHATLSTSLTQSSNSRLQSSQDNAHYYLF